MALTSSTIIKRTPAFPASPSAHIHVARVARAPVANHCFRIISPANVSGRVRRSVEDCRPSSRRNPLRPETNDSYFENPILKTQTTRRQRQHAYTNSNVLWPAGSIIQLAYDLYNENGEEFMRSCGSSRSRDAKAEWQLSVDVIEDAAAYIIKADVPGIKKEEIKLTVTEDLMLVLSAERKAEAVEGGEDEVKAGVQRTTERSYGKFRRAFRLPKNADTNEILAEVKDGVLTIRVPKVQGSPQAKEIMVT